MRTQIQLRGDTAANWLLEDPVLAEKEPGLETDTTKFKFGDGTTPWSGLPYAGGGGSGGTADPTALAAATISGDRAVMWDGSGALVMCDKDDARARGYAGISLNAANVGEVVTYRKVGPITANFWAWSAGPVFVASNGQLSQVPPTSGYLVPVGWAADSTHIDLKPSLIIKR